MENHLAISDKTSFDNYFYMFYPNLSLKQFPLFYRTISINWKLNFYSSSENPSSILSEMFFFFERNITFMHQPFNEKVVAKKREILKGET